MRGPAAADPTGVASPVGPDARRPRRAAWIAHPPSRRRASRAGILDSQLLKPAPFVVAGIRLLTPPTRHGMAAVSHARSQQTAVFTPSPPTMPGRSDDKTVESHGAGGLRAVFLGSSFMRPEPAHRAARIQFGRGRREAAMDPRVRACIQFCAAPAGSSRRLRRQPDGSCWAGILSMPPAT